MRTFKWTLAVTGMIMFLGLIGLTQAGAQDRMMQKPDVPGTKTIPLDRIQPAPSPCPDMAAAEIKFELIQTYQDPNNPHGKVRITALAKNIGKGNFPFSGKLVLLEGANKVAEQAFGNVPSGGEVKTSFERKWFPNAVGSIPVYTAEIIYDPVAGIKSKYEIDCNFNNNKIQRNGQDMNQLFGAPAAAIKARMAPKALTEPARVDPAKLGLANAPNLIIFNPNWTPPTFKEGDKVTFSFQVKNIGTRRAEPLPFPAAFVDGMLKLGGALPGKPGTYLDPGMASSVYSFIWTAKCGSKIKLVADPGNEIQEQNEQDNEWEKLIDSSICQGGMVTGTVVPIPGVVATLIPDLAVTEIKFKLLQKFSQDSGKVEVTATAENKGGSAVANNGYLQLCEGESLKSYHCLPIGTTNFQAKTVAPGQKVSVTQVRDYHGNCGDLLQSPFYKATIQYFYNPGQSKSTPVADIDTNISNNELEKNSQDICTLLKN